MSELVYIGLFLDDDSKIILETEIPFLHSQHYGDHVTLIFRPVPGIIKSLQPFAGKKVPIVADRLFYDFKGQAVGVEIPTIGYYQPNLHITISCAEGVKPAYSNELLKTSNPLPINRILLVGTLDAFPSGSWPVVIEVKEGEHHPNCDRDVSYNIWDCVPGCKAKK